MLRKKILQMILSLVAIATGVGAYEIADNVHYREASNRVSSGVLSKADIIQNAHPVLADGYDGGALGMAIICSVCIICVIWLENMQQKNET